MVAHIFVAPKRGSAMASLPSVEALADAGLAGDRYTQQVTLIELENIEAFTSQ